MSVTPDATVSAYREFTAEQRRGLADEGKALEDGSYPIENVDDLKNAIQALGRAKDPEKVKKHIKKCAADLGAEDLIPEDWAVQPEGEAVFRTDFSAAELAFGEWFVARYGPAEAEAEAEADTDVDVTEFSAPEYIKAMNKPGKNWVERVGGLPRYIEKISNHLIGKGMGEGHAIAAAINTVKRWARGGTASKHGGGQRGQSHVKPDTIAKAIVALAEWEIKKAAAHALASSLMTFADSTADEVATAQADVPPDDTDVLSAVEEGFAYLTEWIADEANVEDPAFDLVKKALDKVGPQLKDLGMKAAADVTTLSADVSEWAVDPEVAEPVVDGSVSTTTTTMMAMAADTEVEEAADTTTTTEASVSGDDPGLNVPLATAQAEHAALVASADSIVEELTAEYTAAVAALEPPG